jgi:hypothetical protein
MTNDRNVSLRTLILWNDTSEIGWRHALQLYYLNYDICQLYYPVGVPFQVLLDGFLE